MMFYVVRTRKRPQEVRKAAKQRATYLTFDRAERTTIECHTNLFKIIAYGVTKLLSNGLTASKRMKGKPSTKQAVGTTIALRSGANRPSKSAQLDAGGKKVAAPKPIVRIGVLIHDVARIRKTLFDQAVKEVGITRAQWWALSNLSRNISNGMSQSDLARYLEVGKPAISGLLDRLVESEMIERHADQEDRRVHRIFITDYGYEVIEQMSPIAVSLNTIFLQGISEKDVKIAEKVLDKMKQNFRTLFGSGPEFKLPTALKPSPRKRKGTS